MRFFSVRKLAKRWSVSDAWVYRALRDGLIVGHKIGGTWRVSPTEVERFESSAEQAADDERDELGGDVG